mgnify:CR=1 FL=1
MKNLKVLMLNGSPHANGNTAVALREMEEAFKANGVEVETVLIGNQAVRGCTACGACYKLGKCVFDDVVNELAPKFEQADGLVVASPVYYASANATPRPPVLQHTVRQDDEGRRERRLRAPRRLLGNI